MLRFFLRRLIGLLFVVIGVTFVTYAMGYLAPNQDPIAALLGQHNTPQAYATLKHEYGLDKPWYIQYGTFLLNLAHGNLGLSYRYPGQSVNDFIGPAIAISIQLGLSALILALVLGIPSGIIAALRANTWVDTSLMSVMLFFYAVPAFVIIPFYQVLIDILVANNLPTLPVQGWSEGLTYKIVPVVILALTSMGYFARISRTVMLEVLRQDYVRTARSKGLSERRVIYLHAFRNALLPLLSVIGPSLAFLVSGAFVIEDLFNIPGVGGAAIQAVANRDWPVLQGTVVVLAVAVVIMNIVVDILYSVADPRIRIQ